MLPFLGFVALCLFLWWLIYRTTQDQRTRWVRNLFTVSVIAGLLGLLVEVWKRGGRLPF